ncbi:recombinase, partial [Hassallia sp. VBCCA 56010]
MSPRYHGTGGKRTTYQCDQLRQQDGVHGICWSIPGATIDTAVANHLLEVLSESNLDISLAVL